MERNQADNGLERKLNLFSITNIVIANMIGAGIFTTSGLLMADLRNPLIMIVLWVVGGIVALCGAFCYGELGAAMPRAGGEYVFLSRLYRPGLGFLSGWVSFFAGFSAPIAASAIGFASYLTRAIPGTLPFDENITNKIYALLLIMVFTGIHLRGIEFGAKVQNYLTILKVGLIAALVLAGFSLGKGNVLHLFEGDPYRFDFGGWKTIGLSLMWIMFAYSGWNAAAYVGSEIKDPVRNLPRSLISGTAIVMALYLLLNLLYIYAASPAEMSGVISIAGLAVGNLFGPTFESLLSIFISFALFSSLSAYVILGPRVYFSMARDGSFFRFASDIHPKYGVPYKSILLQGAVAAAMVMLGRFDQILTYMGFSLGIFPILAVLGIFKLRREGSSTFRMPGYPIVPIVYLTAGLLILSLSLFERPVESGIAILTVLIGVPVYLFFKAFYSPAK